ncbi:vWA domain-containing protein [Limnoglobus roseus]|uniref:VWA domain-containing protein n=1 Tax=Limnoglobus roseus TaxID=2598579 RepID=A0A5C1ALQ6_9BACT|nr:VWA domain-containing protein [Limnoglobus roseus]QEL19117.1 VWA domain-containing protein [Limnoglobus roseus]
MSFTTLPYLLILPLAPLVLWWWLRRRKPALRYSDLSLLAKLPRGRAKAARWLAAGLRGGIVLCVILALAGPRFPDQTTRLPTEGIAMVFACDVSGSMAEQDFMWSPAEPPVARIAAAKRAFELFVTGGTTPDGTHFEGRPGDQIGLVVFAAWPHTECPLTLNHTVLLGILDAEKPRDSGLDAGTNIGDAIAEGLIRLKAASDRKRVLILLSDGEHNTTASGPDSPFTPQQAAQLAANLHVPIYTIECGGDPKPDASAEQRQQREDGRAVLKSVADLTGGKSFIANSGGDLRDIYQQIDRLERQPIVSFTYRRYHDLFPALTAAAVGGLALLILLEAIVWRRVP